MLENLDYHIEENALIFADFYLRCVTCPFISIFYELVVRSRTNACFRKRSIETDKFLASVIRREKDFEKSE